MRKLEFSFERIRFLPLVRIGRRLRAVRTRAARPSLVNRLVFLLLFGIVIIYVTGIAGLRWTSSQIVESTLQNQALQWIEEMKGLGPAIHGRSEYQFLVENRLENFPEIAFLRYYDATGKTLLRSYGPYAGEIPMPTERQLDALAQIDSERAYVFDHSVPVEDSWMSPMFVRVLSPIRVRSIDADGLFAFDPNGNPGHEHVHTAGYLDLGLNPKLHKDTSERSITIAGTVAIVVFLVYLFVGQRMIRRALAPLLDLQTPLARLARGDIDVHVSAKGAAEVMTIGEALNTTIAALKQRDATLRRLADHDSVTGLLNRSSFSRILDAEIDRVRESAATSALLFIDLDRFKYLNDALGHAGGDRLLVQISDLIAGSLRQTDAVARFGGDEFTVLLRDVSRENAEETAKTINTILNEFFFVDQGQTFHVGCSIGVAMIEPKAAGAEEVLLQADAACYEAKAGGRNRYHVFDQSQHETKNVLKDVERAEQIKHALKAGRLHLIYQPIVSATEPGRERYEALLRMRDEEGNLVLPSVFLPIAERFGLLADIDRWVATHALEALAEFRARGQDVAMSINLSGQAFEDPDIIGLVKERLREHRLPPRTVVFEITEQIAVRYMNKARRLMQSLTESGCCFALDDFGVGFSSFSYLKHFPVTYIKIDGSFIENLVSDPMDQAMVRSIVQIAHALGKEVIAEFVQDAETADLLLHYGVDYLQGQLIGMPSHEVPHPCFARAPAKITRGNISWIPRRR